MPVAVTARDQHDITAIRCGRDHTLALLANGKVVGWERWRQKTPCHGRVVLHRLQSRRVQLLQAADLSSAAIA
jgi:alpha-tubulin suppressor-like RCC1 family protein